MIGFETDDVPHELLPVPVGWRVLIAPIKVKEVSTGGIVLVEQTKEHESYFRSVGKVVALGSEAYKHPKFNRGIAVDVREPEPWVKVGDVVHYSNFDGMNIEIKHDGRKVSLKLINDDAVLSVIPDMSVLGLD